MIIPMTMPFYIFVLMTLAVGVTLFVCGYGRGMKKGIEIATDLTITHTLGELKKAANEIGATGVFKDVVDKAFDNAKVKSAEKRLERDGIKLQEIMRHELYDNRTEQKAP